MKRIRVNWSHTGEGSPFQFSIQRLTSPPSAKPAVFLVEVKESGAQLYSYIDEFDPSGITQIQYRITAQSLTAFSAPVDTSVIDIALTDPVAVTTEVLPDAS